MDHTSNTKRERKAKIYTDFDQLPPKPKSSRSSPPPMSSVVESANHTHTNTSSSSSDEDKKKSRRKRPVSESTSSSHNSMDQPSPASSSDDELDWRGKLEEKGFSIDKLHEELQAAKKRCRARIEDLKQELKRIRRFEC